MRVSSPVIRPLGFQFGGQNSPHSKALAMSQHTIHPLEIWEAEHRELMVDIFAKCMIHAQTRRCRRCVSTVFTFIVHESDVPWAILVL